MTTTTMKSSRIFCSCGQMFLAKHRLNEHLHEYPNHHQDIKERKIRLDSKLKEFIENALACESQGELIERIISTMTPDQKKEWEETYEDFKMNMG